MAFREIAFAFSLLLAITPSSAYAEETVLASDLYFECPPLELAKPSFFKRHREWSGIFPIYGGFIGDPHIFCLPAATVSPKAGSPGPPGSMEVQLAYLNPYFRDKTSMILLLITQNERLFVVTIESPLSQEIHGFILEDKEPNLRVLELDNTLFVFVHDLEINGVVRLALPISDRSVQIHQGGSTAFDEALSELSSSGRENLHLEKLCPKDKAEVKHPFVTLASRWFGGCPDLNRARWDANSLTLYYHRQWGQDTHHAP